ncbi:hypothetical protein AVEN_214408-1 [Araneus ventricosus]|uniref:DOMON domain-containing protein n=1 Tax=Araneus ventricosus TaxID=182803 RepID=A0A4Y2TRY8_ARAVE|nr:hypothetical protein AVEN_214408-1 [Araneus ventricosus]
MSLSRYLISVIFFLCLFHNVWPGCVFQDGKYDLSALDLPGGWMVAGPNINGTSSHYNISVCRALNYPTNSSEGGCTNSSVCFFSSDQTTSFGDALDDSKNYAIKRLNRNSFTYGFVHTKFMWNLKQSSGLAMLKLPRGPN